MRRVRSGCEQVSAEVRISRRFRGVFAEFYQTGETAGRLDESLLQIQQYYGEEGGAGLRALAEWVPRVVYFLIVFYVAYAVIRFYAGYFNRLAL